MTAVANTRGAQTAGGQDRQQHTDQKITGSGRQREIPTGDQPDKEKDCTGYKDCNADRRDGMRIEDFQRLNIRGNHRDNGALLFGFQLGGTECAQSGEDLVAQHCE